LLVAQFRSREFSSSSPPTRALKREIPPLKSKIWSIICNIGNGVRQDVS